VDVSIEDKVTKFLDEALDIKPEEIQPDEKIDESLGIDSTEMVEISVGLKKIFNVDIKDNELKKTHSFNEIVEILKGKGAE